MAFLEALNMFARDRIAAFEEKEQDELKGMKPDRDREMIAVAPTLLSKP